MITARVLKIDEKPSIYSGTFYCIFFKNTVDGKSYRSCISNQMRNFKNWTWILNAVKEGEDVVVTNLFLTPKGLIDADSETKRISTTAEIRHENRHEQKEDKPATPEVYKQCMADALALLDRKS